MKRLAYLCLVCAFAACSDDDGPAVDGSVTDAATIADAASTTDAAPSADAAPASGLPCPVEAVLRTRCQHCHSSPPRNGAPVALLTWEDTQRVSGGPSTMKAYVMSGFMPLDQPMPATDRDVIVTWVNAGAPRSTDACPR